jgi:hypothetical protein
VFLEFGIRAQLSRIAASEGLRIAFSSESGLRGLDRLNRSCRTKAAGSLRMFRCAHHQRLLLVSWFRFSGINLFLIQFFVLAYFLVVGAVVF